MKSNNILLPIWIAMALAVGLLLGAYLQKPGGGWLALGVSPEKQKLNRLIDYIETEYVDVVPTDSIVDKTVNDILAQLDPHSVYIPASEYQENADEMRGKFVGVGISFYVQNDTMAVIKPLKGGAAKTAGVLPGDRILYADDVPLFNLQIPRDSLANKLRGPINSKVRVQFYRPRTDSIYEITLPRTDVPLKSVEGSFFLEPTLGYIKVNRFAETTAQEFNEALKQLVVNGMEALVLDLRGNPGGYIVAAEAITDEFLPDGKLILITRDKQQKEIKTYATSNGLFENKPVYVLIDEHAASASEIVAGALQDQDAATIIGRRSFGKGLVQREMPLGDGSAVLLTIARYYTPTGRSIQRDYSNGSDVYYSDYENRYRNGELESKDSINTNTAPKFTTPAGKVVYGGGGIIPDVFIPKDTSLEQEAVDFVSTAGYTDHFMFLYLDDKRNEFATYNAKSFLENIEISDSLTNAFLRYARLNQARFNFKPYREVLKLKLKAALADQLFDANLRLQIDNSADKALRKTQELFKAL